MEYLILVIKLIYMQLVIFMVIHYYLKDVLINLTKTCNFISDDLNIYNSKLDELRWKIDDSSYIVFCGDLIDRKRYYK